MYLTQDDFFSAITGQAEDFPVGAGSVKLRPLTVEEVRNIRRDANGNEATMMALTVLHGVVEPELTTDAIARIQQGAAGSINRLATRIMTLSGMVDREALDS